MKNLIKLSVLLTIISSLSACIVTIDTEDWDDEDGWKSRQSKNVHYINSLDLGQSMSDIEADLGEPDFSDSFQRDGEVFRVLYYRTQRHASDGETRRNETTPLVFIDRKLVGWGNLAVEKATH